MSKKKPLPICPVEPKEDYDYLGWMYDAQRRDEEGQRQWRCATCKRWRWPDFVCLEAVKKMDDLVSVENRNDRVWLVVIGAGLARWQMMFDNQLAADGLAEAARSAVREGIRRTGENDMPCYRCGKWRKCKFVPRERAAWEKSWEQGDWLCAGCAGGE